MGLEEEVKTDHTHWQKLISLPTRHEPFIVIQFAPRHLGLRLAAGTSDGYLFFFQPESLMNLSNWHAMYKTAICATGISCLVWNLHAFDLPTVAIGCFDAEDGVPKPLLEETKESNLEKTNLFIIFVEEDDKWQMFKPNEN